MKEKTKSAKMRVEDPTELRPTSVWIDVSPWRHQDRQARQKDDEDPSAGPSFQTSEAPLKTVDPTIKGRRIHRRYVSLRIFEYGASRDVVDDCRIARDDPDTSAKTGTVTDERDLITRFTYSTSTIGCGIQGASPRLLF